MVFATSFSQFYSNRFPSARWFNLNIALVVCAICFVSLFATLYHLQTGVIEAIEAGNEALATSQASAAGLALMVGMPALLALFVLVGGVEINRARVASRDYNAYLDTLPFESLATQAKGLETDESTRQAIVKVLSRKRPGWSYG